jgi:hypothetical protein
VERRKLIADSELLNLSSARTEQVPFHVADGNNRFDRTDKPAACPATFVKSVLFMVDHRLRLQAALGCSRASWLQISESTARSESESGR